MSTSWARIMVPLTGGDSDSLLLSAAAAVAKPFSAEVAGVYAPIDAAELAPWLSDGFIGGVDASAVEAVKASAKEGRGIAKHSLEACAAENKSFIALESPVWSGLALESRLSDLVVFDQDTAVGKGRLASAFQDLMGIEQRPILVARSEGIKLSTVVVAWDGGKEATRAARTALPLLQKAKRVVVLVAPDATSRHVPVDRLADFLAARGVEAQTRRLDGANASALLAGAAKELDADLMVAGAFGHARLREFVFGGVTRSLLHASGPSLFLSH